LKKLIILIIALYFAGCSYFRPETIVKYKGNPVVIIKAGRNEMVSYEDKDGGKVTIDRRGHKSAFELVPAAIIGTVKDKSRLNAGN